MDITEEKMAGRIRYLNDLLRCKGIGGQVMITAGLNELGNEAIARVLKEVAAFTNFNSDNDPHGERDCAVLSVDGLVFIWKIDYFDRNLNGHSADPSDPSVTSRVMTVMLGEEY